MARSRKCKLVFMANGKPKECGGKIEEQDVDQPFTTHTVIGGPAEPPLFSYARCNKCHIVYDLEDE